MDNMLMQVPGVAVIMFLVWVATNLGMPKKASPLLAWALGLFIAYFTYDRNHVLEMLYYGTFLAASAVGFHSGSKNTFQNFTKK